MVILNYKTFLNFLPYTILITSAGLTLAATTTLQIHELNKFSSIYQVLKTKYYNTGLA